MKRSMMLAFVAALLFGSHSIAEGEKATEKNKIQFTLRLCEGDPLGNIDAGTLKVVACPRLVTFENSVCSFLSGGQTAIAVGKPDAVKDAELVDIGYQISCKAGTIKDGAVCVDLTMSNITLGEKSDKLAQINTESSRMVTNVALGQVVILVLPSKNTAKRTWMEMTVEQVK